MVGIRPLATINTNFNEKMTTRQMLRPLKSPTFSKTKHDILSQKQAHVADGLS